MMDTNQRSVGKRSSYGPVPSLFVGSTLACYCVEGLLVEFPQAHLESSHIHAAR